MSKVGIIILALVAVSITAYLFVPRNPVTKIVAGEFNDIETYIDALMAVPNEDGVLIISVPGTSDFVQFTGGRNGVQMDFPLATLAQKKNREFIEGGMASLGFSPIINVGTDGTEFIDYNLSGTAEEISVIVKVTIDKLYDTGESAPLGFQKYGY